MIGLKRKTDHGRYLYSPGSVDDAGHGGGPGRRIQEDGYIGQAETDAGIG